MVEYMGEVIRQSVADEREKVGDGVDEEDKEVSGTDGSWTRTLWWTR